MDIRSHNKLTSAVWLSASDISRRSLYEMGRRPWSKECKEAIVAHATVRSRYSFQRTAKTMQLQSREPAIGIWYLPNVSLEG
jgi:hypothetical protein